LTPASLAANLRALPVAVSTMLTLGGGRSRGTDEAHVAAVSIGATIAGLFTGMALYLIVGPRVLP
jgi:hypothetical protein